MQRRVDNHLAAPANQRSGPRLDPLAPRKRDLPLAGAVIEHRRDPQRRPVAVGVADRPAARVARIDQAERADDRQPGARRAGRRRPDVRHQLLVQEHVGAVQIEHALAVVPGLLRHPRMGLHQRREAPELKPADQQLRRAALDQPMAEVATDVVRPVRDRAAGGRERRHHQHPQRPEVRRLVAAPGHPSRLLAGPAAASEQHTGARMDLVQGPLHRVPVKAAQRPRGASPGAPV
jgi:hypothetical protein